MTAESVQLSNEESKTVISPEKTVTLKIARSNPKSNSEIKFDNIHVYS